MFEQREAGEEQKEFWIMAGQLPAATPDGFYRLVIRTLENMGFAAEVWKICMPAYAERTKHGATDMIYSRAERDSQPRRQPAKQPRACE